MKYIYIPYLDNDMDAFASSLELKKNEHKWIKRYTHIRRNIGMQPLTDVGWGDTLYVGLHGRAAFYGVGAYTKWSQGKLEVHNVSGMDLAKKLIDDGLPNTWVDLRLWTCYGAASGATPARAKDAPVKGYGSDFRSFAAKVHAAFKLFGYTKVTVTGYKEEVSISGSALDVNKGNKTLLVDDEFVPTASGKLKFS
jgi:hypothetical protein